MGLAPWQGKRLHVMAPACFCGLSCSSSLDSVPTPNRQSQIKKLSDCCLCCSLNSTARWAWAVYFM